MRKYQIQDIILKHLVSEGVFKETILEKYEAPKPEISEQQLQYELKSWKCKKDWKEKKGNDRKG